MGYVFGEVLMTYWAAQFFYGFFIAGVAIAGYGFIYGGGTFLQNLFKGKNVIEPISVFVMSIAVFMAIATVWHKYEQKFFDCESAIAIDGENAYSCRIRESSDGEWSANRSITRGSEPYMKYNRELYK